MQTPSRKKRPSASCLFSAKFLLCTCILLSLARSISSDGFLTSLIQSLELEYEDQCTERAEVELALLKKTPNAFEKKVDFDKNFGHFAKTEAVEMRTGMDVETKNTFPSYRRMCDLLAKPGDVMLETDQWNKFVDFSDKAQHNIQSATDYDCRSDSPRTCSYSDFLSVISTSRDRHLLTKAKSSWEGKMPDGEYFSAEILPLLKDAAKANGYDSVEKYWEMLVEYPDAYEKAQDLWEEIQPLYTKLQKYVAVKLEEKNVPIKEDGSIPSYMLGSLFGDNWLNIAEMVMPSKKIYEEITNNLNQKQMGGRIAYKSASGLLKRLGLDELKEKFWAGSQFDHVCPASIVYFCPSEKIVYTCKNISLALLLDAHEVAMTVKHAEIKSILRANSYMIRNANRFSALDVAISEMASFLAMNPHQLAAEGILSRKTSQAQDKNSNKLTLDLLLALRDIPRLAYYLSADQWRLKLLKGSGPINVGSSWAQTRRNISKVSPSDRDYLGDFRIVSNQPYISQFFGTILKYQIYDALIENEEGDPVEYIAKTSPKMKNMMIKGFSLEWTDIVKDILNIRDINAESITDYFQPLLNFITNELEPNQEENNQPKDETSSVEDDPDTNDDEDPEDDPDDADDSDYNVIGGRNEEENDDVITPEPKKENDESNVIAVVEDDLSITEDYSNNPNLIPKVYDGSAEASSSNLNHKADEQAPIEEASSLQYAWIVLGVLLFIILILGIVIARKRFKHKKELEKERREGTA